MLANGYLELSTLLFLVIRSSLSRRACMGERLKYVDTDVSVLPLRRSDGSTLIRRDVSTLLFLPVRIRIFEFELFRVLWWKNLQYILVMKCSGKQSKNQDFSGTKVRNGVLILKTIFTQTKVFALPSHGGGTPFEVHGHGGWFSRAALSAVH